jgi:hypothetical protein
MASTGLTASEQHANAKKPRTSCKYKEDMFTSHALGKRCRGGSGADYSPRSLPDGVKHSKGGWKPAPTLPLSFNALSQGQMQDLERSFRPRMLFSLLAGTPHDVVGEHLKLKRLLRNNAALGTELAAQAAKHASLTSVGALCVTSFLACVCLRAGFRPCFQEALR